MMKHYFHSQVWQPAETSTQLVSIPSSRDLFPIKFQLFRVTTTGSSSELPKLVAERQTKPLSRGLLLSSSWTRNSLVIWNGTLSGMGIPQEEQPAIVAKIFEALKVAVHFRPIFVVIKDIVTMEEHNVGEASSNEVTFDSLEDEKEKCAICLDEISDFGPKSVTQLPCLHTYHEECIRKWQETRRYFLCSCPKCRYPIPTSEPVSWT